MIRSGDTIRDTQGTAWQLGQSLGRGLWGKSFIVRREFDDALFVLKAPLGPEDFRGEFPFSELVITASRAAILEQARLYGDAGHPFLPRLEARAALSSDATGYILPHFPNTLEARIAAGLPLADLVDILLQVAKLARQLPAGFHGNLRARNILLTDSGGVFFTDVVTNALPRALSRMIAAAPSHAAAFPPEISEATAEVTLNPGCDSWAMAMILWEGVMAGEPLPNSPRQGLEKSAVAAVKDRVMDRMKAEDSNPRFHARLAERVAMLLSRALSRQHTPSPPFRFPKSEELHARLDEIIQLIRPQVQSVGKIMLDRSASKPWFTTDEPVAFTCLAGATTGVEGNEEIGVGIAVFDVLSNERLKDLKLGYTSDRNPSGRYRFAFKIEGLYPGNFRARLAFAIRDSGQPPATADIDFLVRPAPGWVPPEETVPPQALPFEREPAAVAPVVEEPEPAPAPAAVVAPMPSAWPEPARPGMVMPPPPARGPSVIPPRPAPAAVLPPRPAAVPTVATVAAAAPAPGPRVDTVPGYAPRTAPTADPYAQRDPYASRYDDEDDDQDDVELPPPSPAPAARVAPPVRIGVEHTATRPGYPTQVAPVQEEYAPVVPRQGWRQESFGSNVRDLDDEDDADDGLPPPPREPSAIERAWDMAKGDPYVLVVGGLSLVAILLIVAVFFFR